MTPLDIVNKYTSHAIDSKQFGKTLHDALCELIDCLGLAITIRDKNDQSSLVYFIHSNGTEALPMQDKLSECPSSDIQLADIPLNSWSKTSQLHIQGTDDFENEIDGYDNVARVAWELGGYFTYDILLFTPPDSGYSGPVSEYLQMGVNLLATGILRRVEKTELVEAENWINKELCEIAKLQELLRPDNLEDIRGADFAVHAEAYRFAGGDYYDISNLTQFMSEDDKHNGHDMFTLAIADVSGHGPSAVVELAMLDTILRTYTTSQAFLQEERGTQTVATYVNKNMFTRKPRATFTTALFTVYNPINRLLSHTCAGHPAPIWRRMDEKETVELPVTEDIPIRVLKEYEWSSNQTTLAVGDLIVFYTDGIIESRNAEGELFGVERLKEAVASAEPTPQEVLESISQTVNAFTANAAIDDDVTMIAVRYN